ncbi:hypothetical protein ABZ023_17815 [Streptomyces sp. NPDC006367]|uniref:hypothetical protein n=1 Tax=unclassified Streptomyces TaxID=2593676 RepID=UPI0033BB652A
MPLPSWLRAHLPAVSPRWTFESFADEVARLLGLPPVPYVGALSRRFDTEHVWLLWKPVRGGASVLVERPYGELREAVMITVLWHQSPDPADVAAMIRAYERRGRRRSLRSLCGRLLRRR